MAKLKDKAVLGISIGVGAALVAPILLPAIASVGRPLLKAGIRGGLLLKDKIKEKAAETGELLEDLAAEVQAEMAEEKLAAIKEMGKKAPKGEGGEVG